MVGDELSDLAFRHDIVSVEAYMILGIGFAGKPPFNRIEQGEYSKRKARSDKGGKVKSQPQQNSERGRCPDGSGGSQPANAYSFLENHPGAQKSDSRHYPLRHPARIRSYRASRCAVQPMGLI